MEKPRGEVLRTSGIKIAHFTDDSSCKIPAFRLTSPPRSPTLRFEREECMTSPRRYLWLWHLLLCGIPLLAGCELLQHFNQPTKQAVTDPIAGAPSKYEVRVSQFVFISDVKVQRD